MDNDNYNLNEIFVDNWNDYLSDIPQRCDHMYNLINYNQFCNEEIRKLERRIKFLKKDIELEIQKSNEFSDKYEDMRREYFLMKDKYNKEKEKNNEKIPSKRDREEEKWLTKEKRKKPRNYKFLDSEIFERRINDLFSKIKSIDDIINLKDNENRHDYFKNVKFTKLYKLIPSLEELNGMIGLENIKKDIFDTICFFIHGLNNDKELNHVVITGEPGVGKTTLAELIGKIYLALGFLNSSKFKVARRSDLIAQYLGQTAPKTQKVIDEAMGGVLFIDEVYSLGNNEKRDSFAKECIDTINQNLSENCNGFLCIVAGYKEDVKRCFFDYNRGLERRFTIEYNIEKYSVKSLTKILEKFIKNESWSIDFSLEDLVNKNKEILKYQAGDLRTLFKIAKQEYSKRLMNSSVNEGAREKNLKIEDFEVSFRKLKEKRKEEHPEFLKSIYI